MLHFLDVATVYLSIHLLEGHLDCFQVLAIMKKAPINILVQFLCEHKVSVYGLKQSINTVKDYDCSIV